jgi:hypothetical protein
MYEIGGMYEIAGPQFDTDIVAGMSREKMNKRKKARHKTAKTKWSKTNIHIGSEYYREKAGYPRIRRKRKSRATQNSQDRSRIFQDEKISNERAIQATCE